jgi:hypothetical protein
MVKYLGTRSVCQRYDKKDRTWPWKEQRRNPDFPRPVMRQNNRPLWDHADLDAYDERLKAATKGERGNAPSTA